MGRQHLPGGPKLTATAAPDLNDKITVASPLVLSGLFWYSKCVRIVFSPKSYLAEWALGRLVADVDGTVAPRARNE
jgi:hypothetical protein